jgi:hypothetical protein
MQIATHIPNLLAGDRYSLKTTLRKYVLAVGFDTGDFHFTRDPG